MKYYIVLICSICLATTFLVSCDTGNRNQVRQSGEPSTLNLLPPLPATAPAMATNRPVVPVLPIVPGSIAAPPSGNVKLNPAHGQPGHRCDIPEGSPLPGAVSAPSVAAVVNGIQPVTQSNAKPNPKHGEPGHRCDIPVGAPLDSPPGQVQPATTANTAKTTTGNTKLNPKHGEPGHRCDIAVGAPLDSPPANANTGTVKPANSSTTQPADSSSGSVKQ